MVESDIARLAKATYSSILQVLIDAEEPVRIATGDAREELIRALSLIGLVEYRKSGWWRTSEKGHRLVGGSGITGGFKLALTSLTEEVIAANQLLARPRGLTYRQGRHADQVLRAAEYLAKLNARDEKDPCARAETRIKTAT